MNKKLFLSTVLSFSLLESANAITVTYPSETIVFDTYDFAPGVVAIDYHGPIQVGQTFDFSYQSFLGNHYLSSSFVPSGVNTSYEVTVFATGQGIVTGYFTSPQIVAFDISGNYSIYYDSNINHDFTGTGSGFTDGILVMTGTILGNGVNDYDHMTGLINIFSPSVTSFLTSPISSGSGIFGLIHNNLPPGATGVGTIANPDRFFSLDGNMTFSTPVPEPLPLVLMGTGLIMIGMIIRSSRSNPSSYSGSDLDY